MRRIIILALVALATGFGLAVSGGPAHAAATTSPSPEGTVLRVGWLEKPDNLNPFIGTQTNAYNLYHLNYEFLVSFDAASLEPSPGLAESWSHSKDGKTWTFELREGVTWQDGEPFTADDVVFTYNLVMGDPPMGSYVSYTQGITSVKAIDDHTVQFTTSKPKADILQMWVPIVPKHVWSKISPEKAANSFPNNPPCIGTGPFQVVEWKRGSYVRLKANPTYWGGAPKIDEILFIIYQNADTMTQDLKNGTIQFARVAAAAFKSFESTPGFTTHLATARGYDDLGFNCYEGPSKGNPVLKDPAFRRALAWAIDREKIAAIAYGGAAVPATSILPSGYYNQEADYHWQPAADQEYRYDPAKAEELLDEAGYRDTDGDGIREFNGKPIHLRLWALTDKTEYDLSGKLIAGWLQDAGLGVTYQVMDEGALSDRIYNTEQGELTPDFDMFLWNWDGDFDPGFLLSVLLTSQIGDWSDTDWSNAEYDRLYDEQATTLDPTQRREIIWRMQQILYEECPYIPLVYSQHREVFRSDTWQGWVIQPQDTGTVDNPYTYMAVHPVATSSASGEGGGVAWLPIAVGGVAAVAVILVVVLVRRRRQSLVEEV